MSGNSPSAAAQPRALILMYHNLHRAVADPFSIHVSPEHFAGHIQVLQDSCRMLSLGELERALMIGEIPTRSVVITFDDGYASTLQIAKPLLQRHKMSATVFVTTGFVQSSRELWWDELERILLEPGTLPKELNLNVQGNHYHWNLGDAATYSKPGSERYRTWRADDPPPTPRHQLYMTVWRLLRVLSNEQRLEVLNALATWMAAGADPRQPYRGLSSAELQQLAFGGFVEIGAHTVTHPMLPELSSDEQRCEVSVSKQWLEEVLRVPVSSFAYPYGAFSASSAETVRRAGFACACSTIPTLVDRHADRWKLPRVQVCDWSPSEFASRLENWFAADGRSRWELRVSGGNDARLLHPAGGSHIARIQIDRVASATPFDIQLNLPIAGVIGGREYEIRFRARADAPRAVTVGFAQAHHPWTGLGLYESVEIDPEWDTFHLRFVPVADEQNARIHFDAGGNPISLDVSDVEMRLLKTDTLA